MSSKPDLLACKVFEYAPEGMLLTDAEGTILIVNDALCNLSGYKREELLGNSPSFMKSGYQDKHFYEMMWKTLLTKGKWSGEIHNRHKNGHIFVEKLSIKSIKNDSGKTLYYIGQITEITQEYKKGKYFEHIAHHDPLTGLVNRILFKEHLHKVFKNAELHKGYFTVACIDIDDFKPINDSYGHAVGDKLLIEIAHRLKKAVPDNDIVARFGGDEFMVILQNFHPCNLTFERIQSILAEAYIIDGIPICITSSMGITSFPQNENIEAEHLLRQADQAMYQAKLFGKNSYKLYDTISACNIKEKARKLRRIAQALRNEEFVLYCQPKINMKTSSIIGAEVLLRWQHPEKGLLPPSDFLPLIEKHSLSKEVDLWVIKKALQLINEWPNNSKRLALSVNIGSLLMEDKNFFNDLRSMIVKTQNFQKGLLELEILENSALDNINSISKVINSCQELGVNFALDDFGTGYSSLNYIKLLPVKNLKIDQSFVRNMLDDHKDQSIIRTIIELASILQIDIIAEGVESKEHGKVLLDLGCHHGQGYAIAKPMPMNLFFDWIKQNNTFQ